MTSGRIQTMAGMVNDVIREHQKLFKSQSKKLHSSTIKVIYVSSNFPYFASQNGFSAVLVIGICMVQLGDLYFCLTTLAS